MQITFMTSLIDVIYPKGNHSQIQNQNEIEFPFCINKKLQGFHPGMRHAPRGVKFEIYVHHAGKTGNKNSEIYNHHFRLTKFRFEGF